MEDGAGKAAEQLTEDFPVGRRKIIIEEQRVCRGVFRRKGAIPATSCFFSLLCILITPQVPQGENRQRNSHKTSL